MNRSGSVVLEGVRKTSGKTRQTPSIKEVLSYKNPGVVARYQEKLSLSLEEANQLFEDVKRFLWVGAIIEKPIAPSPKIDEGWHNFILFTKDYANFCSRYFGRFIHHIPRTPGQEARSIPAKKMAKKFFARLSSNWNYKSADCEDCAPLTNCESQPSDCALN